MLFILLIFDCDDVNAVNDVYRFIILCYIECVCVSLLACDDNCTGILLDTVANLSNVLATGTSHIADGYIPPPWKELTNIDSIVTGYVKEVELRTRLQQRMKTVPWHEYKKLTEDVEVMLRNVCNYNIIKCVIL